MQWVIIAVGEDVQWVIVAVGEDNQWVIVPEDVIKLLFVIKILRINCTFRYFGLLHCIYDT